MPDRPGDEDGTAISGTLDWSCLPRPCLLEVVGRLSTSTLHAPCLLSQVCSRWRAGLTEGASHAASGELYSTCAAVPFVIESLRVAVCVAAWPPCCGCGSLSALWQGLLCTLPDASKT